MRAAAGRSSKTGVAAILNRGGADRASKKTCLSGVVEASAQRMIEPFVRVAHEF